MGSDVETCVFAQPEIYISIHAPRMGSDDLADLILDTISRISIHAPRMGSAARARRNGYVY